MTRNYNNLTIIFILLWISNITNAQNYVVTGTILNEDSQAIPFATVSILSSNDSTFIKGSIAGESGKFSIELEPNSYILKISMVSYLPFLKSILVKNRDLDVGDLILNEKSIILEGIEVRAERSTFTTNLDKKIFNVGQDLSSRGGNASDILENVPSVSVDVEGNISLRGTTNVRILINGKESAMISDGGAFLRQLPANMIKQIEVITNPSARYQADGESGIINIVLLNNTEKKLNGSIEASIAHPAQHNLSYIINWRNDKIGLSSSYGIMYRKFKGGGKLTQDFFDENLIDYRSTQTHQRGGLNHNFKLGFDWYVNKKNTINIVGLFNPRIADNGAIIEYEFDQFIDNKATIITREDIEDEKAQQYELAITHSKIFSNKKHILNNSLSWNRRDDIENNKITETSNNSSNTLVDLVDNREDAQFFIIQSDYIHPYSKKGKVEFGIKVSKRVIENEFLVEESINGSDFIVLENFDNLFRYTEDIYSAYAMTGNKINKWSYQCGLRIEHSDIVTDLTKNNERNPRSYTNLFPSGLISYEIKELTEVQLSYSKRITRPRLWHLFPFFTFSDSRNLISGNPLLNPEITNSFELSWIKKHNSGSMIASLVYRQSEDVVQRITAESNNEVTRRFPINIAEKQAYGMEFTFGFRPLKWWKIDANTYSAYEVLKGEYDNIILDNETFFIESKVTNNIKIDNRNTLKVFFVHQGPRNGAQGITKSRMHANLAFSHKFLNNKANITLGVTDLFNSRKRRSITTTESFYQESEYQRRQRQVILNFRYQIGKEDQNKRERKS